MTLLAMGGPPLEAITLNKTLPQVFRQLALTPNEESSLQGQCQRPGPTYQQADGLARLWKQDASREWEECSLNTTATREKGDDFL